MALRGHVMMINGVGVVVSLTQFDSCETLEERNARIKKELAEWVDIQNTKTTRKLQGQAKDKVEGGEDSLSFDNSSLPGAKSDMYHRQKQDSEEAGESTDLDFIYDDADSYTNEIAELYSYTEQHELQYNFKAFEEIMESYKLRAWWQPLSREDQQSIIYKLLDQLEVSSKHSRMKAARCILYLAQGCWAEVQSDREQQEWARTNVMLLYSSGVFAAFIELLNIEIENNTAASSAMRKLSVSLADSVDLRVILSVLYIMTETMREESKNLNQSEYKDLFLAFKEEISNPFGEELLIIKLLGMVTCFCSGSAPHFPMKKVLLLLWKVILVSLGGIETLRELKNQYRLEAGLEIQIEDTMDVIKTMRPSSPPTSAADLLEPQKGKRDRNESSSNLRYKRSLIKQSSLDEPGLAMDYDERQFDGENERSRMLGLSDQQGNGDQEDGEGGNGENDLGDNGNDTIGAEGNYQNYYEEQNEQVEQETEVQTSAKVKAGLPWTPKVRQKEIDTFLDVSRLKFIGYKLQGDRVCVAGLPQPIHEGLNILKHHMYTSLADVQIQKEEEIARNPMSTPEFLLRQTPTEILYQAMLPNLPQNMIALLKILLAAAPTTKAKTDSINIMADVLPEEMPMTVVQSMKLGIDVNRHKEIIVKAVSAILLLFLKHFKINHIYQFEFMSQHLVFANCVPLVLKFLNQNLLAYIEATNVIPILDFPMCVIGDQPEMTVESVEIGDNQPYSWRNVFSCINLLRILNKLTKWKHSRIMMLVVFKSAPILKRSLKVMHAMMQLYVLKLLKMQTRYLGRQWRKTNMKTISVIYAKVRHRLNDDWAYGNDLEARPWDFQDEECALRSCVDDFNNRRYSSIPRDEDYAPMDTSISSALGANIELTDEFKQHYDLWVQQEVFETDINWDKLFKYTEKTCEL